MIKQGTLICTDEGAYSDYQVTGFFVALKQFDPHELLRSYLELHPDQAEDYVFNTDQFLAYMIAEGCLLEIDYTTIHLSDWGCAKDFRVHKHEAD